MVIEGNVLQSHPLEAGIPQGSPVLPILFAIHIAGLMKWVQERVHGVEGLCFVDDLRWVATSKDVKQVVRKLEACAAESIQWASRRDLHFDPAKMEAALFTRRSGHTKHVQPKLTAKFKVRNGFVRFNIKATRWLGVWMDAHLTFTEHHNCGIKQAKASEARLRVLTWMQGIVPMLVRAVQVGCAQAVALYGSELR